MADTMEKTMITMVIVIMGMVLIAQVVQAQQPVLAYTCPIDGEQFATYEELHNHFTSTHPTTPIDIIWE